MGMDETDGFAKSPRAARSECPEQVAEQATIILQVRVGRVVHCPTAPVEAPPADPLGDPHPDGETWTSTTWNSARKPTHLAAGMDPQTEDPPLVDRHQNPPAKDRPEDRWEEDHLVDPE